MVTPTRHSFALILGALLHSGFLTSGHAADGKNESEQSAKNQQEMLGNELVLTGAQVSTSVSANRLQSPITIEWAQSQLVSPESSTLSIRLNGEMLHTQWLGTDGKVEVEIPDSLNKQTNLLSIEASLRIDEDPCLIRLRESAWIRLQGISQPGHPTNTTFIATPEKVGRNLRDTLSSWNQIGNEVSLQVPSSSPRLALEAALFLLDEGLEPTLEEEALSVQLILSPPLSTNDSKVHVRWDAKSLQLTGGTREDLIRALYLLRKTKTKRLCGKDGTCSLRAKASELSRFSPKAETQPKRQSATLDLEEIGYSQGFEARGSGQHALRMVWQRPKHWRLSEAPVVDLQVRVPESMRGHEAFVHLRVEGVTFQSFSLSQALSESISLKAKIPEEYWKREALVLDFVVSIDSEEGICQAQEDQLWVVLSPNSGLFVSREELDFGGIASVAKRITRGEVGVNQLQTQEQGLFVAKLLSELKGTQRPIGWNQSDASLVVSIAKAAHMPRVAELAVVFDAPQGTLNLETTDSGSRLSLWFPRSDTQPPSPPVLSTLHGKSALLFEGEWIALDKVGPGSSKPLSSKRVGANLLRQTPRLQSQEEERTRTLSKVWIGGTGIILLLLLGYWARKPKTVEIRRGMDIERH